MKLVTPTRAGGGAALAAFLSISLICSAAAGAAPPPSAGVVAGEAIVRFAPVGAQVRGRALAAADAEWGASVRGVPGARRVELEQGESVAAAVRTLNRQPGVRWAEPNYIYSLAETPDDPFFPDLWGMRNTGQEVQGVSGVAGFDLNTAEAWDTTTGSDDVRVAIVDSGIDPTHPDLQGNLNEGLSRNFVVETEGEAADPDAWDDLHMHGTHVAGTVGAVGDNGLGVTGVAWDAELVASRICNIAAQCPSAAIAEGLAYAGQIGARVANASIGGPEHSFATEAAVAAHPETLYVIAAGNESLDNDATPSYPCALPQENIVCVAAIDSSGGLADFSNYGAETVDVGAPGVDVLSASPELVDEFDGSGGLAPWSQEPPDRWKYEEGVIELKDGTPLPAESTLSSATSFDLSGGEDCRLTHALLLDTTEGEQNLFVEISTNGVDWTPVQGEAGGYSGTTGKFVELTEKLAAFDGESEVWLRYRLEATPTGQGESALVAIAGAKVACIHPQPPGGAYVYESGTSMASPHVAGAAALAFAAHPGAAVQEVRAAILDTAVPTASLQGVTATGGRVDAAAVLEELGREEPEPEPGPQPQPQPRPGWALGLPAGHRVVVSPGGRARLRVRCRADVVRRCRGRLVLLARVRRGRRGFSRQRVVLAARGFTLAKGRRAVRAAWLRPRPARLLRKRRLGRVQLLIRTRQPQAAERRLRRNVRRVGLRLRPARRAAGRR